MVLSKIIEILKNALDVDLVKNEERYEAEKFAMSFGKKYLENENYDTDEVVAAINAVLTRMYQKSKRLIEFIVEALQTMFPEINKQHPFKLNV